MTPELAIQKLSREMIQRGLIRDEAEEEVQEYLRMAIGVGFNHSHMKSGHEKPVGQYTRDGKFLKVYPSMKVAANSVHRNINSLVKALNGKNKTCAGYVWKYVPAKTNSR